MATGVPRSTNPPGAVVIDPRVWVAGGAVALIGVIVVVAFLWMVPRAAVREVRAACAALRPEAVPNPALCRQGDDKCRFPLPAPDFTALDHNGKSVHLSDFRGKIVLLNFWASWCHVCHDEKPSIRDMSEDLGSDDFVVLALASDRRWSDALLAVVDALVPGIQLPTGNDVPMSQVLGIYQQALPDGVPFQVALDPPADDSNIGQIASSWGIKAVPESALIDREGNIRAYFVNKRDWDSSVAETCLRSLIDEER
jgi:thiol-disulfide isomerase/thioredoxin